MVPWFADDAMMPYGRPAQNLFDTRILNRAQAFVKLINPEDLIYKTDREASREGVNGGAPRRVTWMAPVLAR